MREISTDILILGSGGAGLFAALHANKADPTLSITVAVKGLLGKCGCTRMVQGGYNVALNPGDSIERHFMDTIEGGKWLPHQELACTLVSTAVERVRELENEIGCFFDRNADGTLHALQEGFREMHGLQCCFCTPGMIVRAYRLLQESKSPSEEEIRVGISGNLCRCTGYQNIVKAIQYAAARINGVPLQEAAE